MKNVSRMLLFSVLAAAAGLLAGGAPAARAAAPMAHASAPGYYRFMLGGFEVTALNDGTSAMKPATILRGITPAAIDAALARQFESSPVQTSVNAFLVNTGSALVLIDTGTGAHGPSIGLMLKNLKASGYTPEQVDDVLITHMHPDHIGGLVADGKRVFPNATVWVNKKGADYWLDPANIARAGKGREGVFTRAMAVMKPYKAAGHFKTFTGSTIIVPGIRSMPEPGHTPGHSGYLVSSRGQTMLAWGDIIHVQAVQFPDPSVTVTYDSTPDQARATRLKVLAMAAGDKTIIAGAHLAFPGVGHVRKDGQGYTWVPLNYTLPQ